MPLALTADTRTAMGRRAKHVLDTENIPAVVYGRGVEPRSVQVKRGEFRQVYKAAGHSALVDLTVAGATPVKVLVKEVQVHPLTLDPVHIDFHQLNMNETLTTSVPLRFIGESAAVKALAGTLTTPFRSLKVRCLPADLPHDIEVDISVLATFEDSISVGDLNIPKTVTVLDSEDATVATVVPPLTEEQLKKLEESTVGDVTTIKTEAEEKKAADEAKVAEEAKAAEVTK